MRIANGSKETLKLGKIEIDRDWGWAPDYVEAMWRILKQDQPDDFVIATGEERSLQDFVAKAFDCVGLDWNDHVVSDNSLFRPLDIERSCGDASKAARELGWRAEHKFDRIIEMLVDAERIK